MRGGAWEGGISECFDKLTKNPTISYQTCKRHVYEATKRSTLSIPARDTS